MATETVARAAGALRVNHRSNTFGIAIAILVALSVLALPTPAGLTPEGKRTAAILLAALALWATEAIPVAVTALLALILQPIFGVGDLPAAFNSFISPVFFFVLVMFFIAQAFVTTGLARRYALWLLARAGTDARRVVFAFVAGTGLLSTVISDVPCCAIFMAIAIGMFEKLGLTPGRSRFAKSLMIGIPMASMIGGVGTPAGSSINVLGLHFIEQYGKVRVPFLHWMAIGIPMVLVLIPLSAWALTRFYPPEMKTIGEMEEIQAERASLGPMTAPEWKVAGIMGVMIVLWILGTWVKQLDLVLVGMAGGIAMFLPGMNLFNWKQVERATGWEVLLMIGGVTSLGAASVRTGLAKWLVDASIGGVEGWNVIWIIALISAFTVVIHLLLPIAPVINAVLIPPIVMLAVSTGQNPALYALPVAFTASCAFLLPLDAVALITYGKGYYRMFDMFLPGAVVSVC
ncbi:MAG: DASS family sodium-coupled anion symporter, partial [Phycisphaerales bacterium]|nr:DASS family sodium-coupled anion symporter [Phycisphaerales bacterium]